VVGTELVTMPLLAAAVFNHTDGCSTGHHAFCVLVAAHSNETC
jgi:hypothetical protein